MATWNEFESAEPEFAAVVRRLLDAHKHKTIATLRADGSPRISGIEIEFAGEELTFGSMPGARKGDDLRRDPRFALHSASVDAAEGEEASWPGDAKVAGLAVPAGALEGDAQGALFHADLREVVVTGLNESATMLVVRTWTPTRGLRRIERA
jgi:hypothetical protein